LFLIAVKAINTLKRQAEKPAEVPKQEILLAEIRDSLKEKR
jgi:large-conductance mechanosensitive channel